MHHWLREMDTPGDGSYDGCGVVMVMIVVMSSSSFWKPANRHKTI